MVTQSIVPYSPHDRLRLSNLPVQSVWPTAAVANVASIIVVVVLTPSGGVFDILLSVARIDDSATAETNADFGRRRRRRRHGNRSLRVGVVGSSDRRMMRVSGGRLCLHLPLTSPAAPHVHPMNWSSIIK